MGPLLKQGPEPIGGAFHPHLERRDADPRQRFHFVVAQLVHVLEQKCLSLVRIERRQRPVDTSPMPPWRAPLRFSFCEAMLSHGLAL
jgi:hypothetical protein